MERRRRGEIADLKKQVEQFKANKATDALTMYELVTQRNIYHGALESIMVDIEIRTDYSPETLIKVILGYVKQALKE